jgi:hypothetical protein
MYQTDDLTAAVHELMRQVSGLSITIEPTGKSDATAQGTMPTIACEVTCGGRRVAYESMPIVAVPANLADDLARS